MSTEQTTTPAAEKPKTPLETLTARLPDITSKADYKEMWGVELAAGPDHIPTQVILQKYLRANTNDVEAAATQLTSSLEWRKKMNVTSLLSETYDQSKFGDLGFVTVHKDDAGKDTVITWNIYGAVKDNQNTFGDVEQFVKWRAALMELSVQKLKLNEAKELIPEDGDDQYQMLQVHDYKSVSFFRMDPNVKAASRETIKTFSMAYPELLAHKYFVNVPAIMGWMYGAMKLFLAPATLRKFHPMTSGTTLATDLTSIVSTLPAEYGGKGPSANTGETVKLGEKEPAAPAAAETAEAAAPTKKDEEAAPVAEAEQPKVEETKVEETKADETKVAEEPKAAETEKVEEAAVPEAAEAKTATA